MTEAEAYKRAQALVERLHGGEWVPRVWENLGWHYSAVLDTEFGCLTVYPMHESCDEDEIETFYALLSTRRGMSADEGYWWDQDDPRDAAFEDPNESVRGKLEMAKDFVDKVASCVLVVGDAVGFNRRPDPSENRCVRCGSLAFGVPALTVDPVVVEGPDGVITRGPGSMTLRMTCDQCGQSQTTQVRQKPNPYQSDVVIAEDPIDPAEEQAAWERFKEGTE
jgi:hypothetical protein